MLRFFYCYMYLIRHGTNCKPLAATEFIRFVVVTAEVKETSG